MFFKKVYIKVSEIIPIQKITWSDNHKKLFENDYDEKIGMIILGCDNKIIDGNHRFSIISQKKSGNHKIKVIKLSIKRKTFFIFVYLLFPIILPIAVINLIKNKI